MIEIWLNGKLLDTAQTLEEMEAKHDILAAEHGVSYEDFFNPVIGDEPHETL